MSKLIAYFEYNNIKYYISLLDNKRILFLKSNKSNKFSLNLSNNEQKLLKQVYKSLLINPDKSFYIKNLEVNSNNYSIFFDTNSHKHFWIPTNGKYNEKDNKFLNFKYNHEPEIIYSENKYFNSFQTSQFYTKFIKIGSKLIPLLVSAAISLTLLTGCTIPSIEKSISQEITINETITIDKNQSIEEIESFEETEITNEYNYEKIKQAISNNSNLTDKEKNFIYKLQFLFDENNQYMDLDLIIDRLSNLQIKYGINLGGADAAYDLSKNIMYSNAENFANIKKATFVHEFLHVLQNSGNSLTGELSTEYFTQETMLRLYKEGLVEKEFFLSQYAQEKYDKGNIKLENENDWLIYLSKNKCFSSGYSGYDELYFILAEILSPETLRYYQFNPSNIEMLTTELIQIDSRGDSSENEETRIEIAYELIDSINELRTYSSETNNYTYSRDISECCEILDYYYEQNKGTSLANDIKCSIYLELDNRFKENIDTNITNYLTEKYDVFGIYNVISETHLSNAQETPILIYYDSNREAQIIELNDEVKNEYQSYNSQYNNNIR